MKRFNNFVLAVIATFYCFSSCTNVECFEKTASGVKIDFETEVLDINVCGDNIIRVQYYPKGEVPKHKSLVVIKKWSEADFTVKTKGSIVNLKTKNLGLSVDTELGLITYFDTEGNPIVAENNKSLVADTVMEEPVYNVKQSWQLSDGEAIYGLGQLPDGRMNYRDSRAVLVQTNSAAVNPFIISTKSYGILWDNYSKTIFEDDDSGASFWSEVGEKIDYYFIYGKNMDEVISGYRTTTGKAPMFGKWAFGFWQCKERYKDYAELRSVVDKHRELGIPLDNIVQDWCYWADYSPTDDDKTWVSAKENWSSMYYHPSTYSDPKAAIKELHEKYNVHYMVSVWPTLGVKSRVYKEMSQSGHLFSPTHWSGGQVYDAYSLEARSIYWKHLKAGIIDMGADALWMDGTEPEIGEQHTVEDSEIAIKNMGNCELGSMARYMNAFSLMTTSGAYNNFRNDTKGKRFFTLTRSAFAGQQRNGAATWSGDINARFDVLRAQIASGVNFSMSGIPYWTTDIGAFFIKARGGIKDVNTSHGPGQYPGGHTDSSYRELYVRWFQYGAFCPLFRSHGTHTPRETWQFGKEGEWAYDALVKYNHLRYRLLPYIYSLSWQVTNEDYTMMRGLAMDFTSDSKVYDIDNEFMLGASLLVAPVTEHQYFPLENSKHHGLDKVRTSEVYLPAGTNWYDFWTGEELVGGQTVLRPTPIDIMPLYVKGGSIVPMGPYKQYSTEKYEDPIELRVYTGADAEFSLYEDENDNYNYEQGVYATINFEWNEETKILTIHDREGQFPGMQMERTINIVWVGEGHGVDVAPTVRNDISVTYVGKKIEIPFVY